MGGANSLAPGTISPSRPGACASPPHSKHGAVANEVGHLRLFELARVLVCFHYVACFIVNADHSVV
jgi:hypothetical protein